MTHRLTDTYRTLSRRWWEIKFQIWYFFNVEQPYRTEQLLADLRELHD